MTSIIILLFYYYIIIYDPDSGFTRLLTGARTDTNNRLILGTS